MVDKTQTLILTALQRAAAEPQGLPLLGRNGASLFSGSSSGRQAAQLCKDQGFLHTVNCEARGKTTHEICALTDKGLAFLIDRADPKGILQALVRSLDARQGQLDDLVHTAQQARAGLDSFNELATKVLRHVQDRQSGTFPIKNGTAAGNGHEPWLTALGNRLAQHHASGALEDCPLPDLYRLCRQVAPGLTIGQFHDGLRRLHQQQQIYLHPWTGPLHELPEPTLGLLIGHEIIYYASKRTDG